LPAVLAASRAVARLPGLESLLEARVVCALPGLRPEAAAAVLSWGRKPSAARAQALAARWRLPLLRLEDGFLRSVGLGAVEPPLSLVVDDVGIYYDASASSRLERCILSPLNPSQRERARGLIAIWRAERVSKYNHAREFGGRLPARYVLVADQTAGDASLRFGLAEASSFQRMLEAALVENPACTVLLKVHPEVMAGTKTGHYDLANLSRHPRIQVLAEDVHPPSLIEHAEAVYAVTSQIGFEGLLWGKRVRTFGLPFYAGWGLTEDDLAAPERRGVVPLENLVHAALVDYPRYLDPETGRRCEAERLLAWMGLQRRRREHFPLELSALDFSCWKRPIVRNFFQGSRVRFVRRAPAVPTGTTLAVWGHKPVAGTLPDSVRLLRLEDGFLRSVGLGADLVRPLSWVMDGRGIYYDATRPSDLEHLLQTTSFDESLLVRAGALREQLVTAGLTKYNVGAKGWQGPIAEESTKKRLILVPGQVESDASLAYGAPGLCRNLDLLRAVREANPEAYVIYKPHPDVVAGLRRQGAGEGGAALWCDELVVDVAMGELLPRIDEVHTLTSLTGFEALLRGKRVVCYGQPFYAGWGLTEDKLPVARRSRQLTLDELVAGVLIEYPTYVSRTTGRFTTPERALEELQLWRKLGASGWPWWRKALRWVLRWLKN
jgi:capsular polysaccharide export protein